MGPRKVGIFIGDLRNRSLSFTPCKTCVWSQEPCDNCDGGTCGPGHRPEWRGQSRRPRLSSSSIPDIGKTGGRDSPRAGTHRPAGPNPGVTPGMTIGLASNAVHDHSVTGGVFLPIGIKWPAASGVFPARSQGFGGLVNKVEKQSRNGIDDVHTGLYAQVL
jgi:hypothetical protein